MGLGREILIVKITSPRNTSLQNDSDAGRIVSPELGKKLKTKNKF